MNRYQIMGLIMIVVLLMGICLLILGSMMDENENKGSDDYGKGFSYQVSGMIVILLTLGGIIIEGRRNNGDGRSVSNTKEV